MIATFHSSDELINGEDIVTKENNETVLKASSSNKEASDVI
jgi:hypothetical protein